MPEASRARLGLYTKTDVPDLSIRASKILTSYNVEGKRVLVSMGSVVPIGHGALMSWAASWQHLAPWIFLASPVCSQPEIDPWQA